MIAVLPAAGKGTRMASFGGGCKELLPVAGKPVLQWALEEAEAAGAVEIVVVTSPLKGDLNDFIHSFAATFGVPIRTVEQAISTGLAPAVALAGSSEDALIVLPDTLYCPASPLERLSDALIEGAGIVIAANEVDASEVGLYGILDVQPSTGRIVRIVEKPLPEFAPSRWAVAGRMALSAPVMAFLGAFLDGSAVGGVEIPLTPVLNAAIANGVSAKMVAVKSEEIRYDCGSPEGYDSARRALERPLP